MCYHRFLYSPAHDHLRLLYMCDHILENLKIFSAKYYIVFTCIGNIWK